MKRYRFLIAAIIIILLGTVIFLLRLFDLQYNLVTGISSSMTVELNENQKLKKLGVVKENTIYVEGIDPDKSYFMTIFSNKMSLRKAVQKKKVSIRDMKRKCISQKTEGKKTILEFENYEVVLENNKCTFRAKEKK